MDCYRIVPSCLAFMAGVAGPGCEDRVWIALGHLHHVLTGTSDGWGP